MAPPRQRGSRSIFNTHKKQKQNFSVSSQGGLPHPTCSITTDGTTYSDPESFYQLLPMAHTHAHTHTHTHTRSAFSKRRLPPLKHTDLFRSAAALHSFDHRKWDLQNLNSVGAGQIGQGLWALASISGTIRSGCGSLPTSIGSSIESGANWVLNQTGIGTSVEQT